MTKNSNITTNKDYDVSVVVVTYNHEKFIEKALEGIVNQFCDLQIELLISNDKSPDQTEFVIDRFIKQTIIPNNITINYILQEENRGAIPNFMWSLEQVKGKYIAICEGDDYWTDPYKLQKQVDFLEHNLDYAACFTNIDVLKGAEYTNGALKDKHKKHCTTVSIMEGFWIPTLTVMYRKKTLPEPFPPQIYKVPNGDVFLFHLLVLSGDIGYLDFVSGVYRQHDGGIWSGSDFLEKIDQRIVTLKHLADYFQDDESKVKEFNKRIKRNQWRKVEYFRKKRNMRLLFKEYARFSIRYPLDSFKFLSLLRNKNNKYI